MSIQSMILRAGTAALAIAAIGAPAAWTTPVLAGDGPAPVPVSDSSLLNDLEAWWQFDWGDWFDNEVMDGPGLSFAPGSTTFFGAIPGGAERALDCEPNGFSAARLPSSNQADHWTAPVDGVVTALIVMRPDGFPKTGDPQTLLSKWEIAPRVQWRIGVDPAAEAIELVVETSAGTQSISAGGLALGERMLVLARIASPGSGLESTVDVIGADGVLRGTASMTLAATYQSEFLPHLEVARSSQNVGHAAESSIDIVAIWSRALTGAERNDLAGLAGGLRFADISGVVGQRPAGFKMERVADVLDGNIRHVVMGDSFCSTLGYNRVFPAILKVHDFSPLVGISAGVRPTHALIRSTSPIVDDAFENPRTIDAQDFYACEWINGLNPSDHYSIPVHTLSEIRGHAGAAPGDGGVLYDMVVNDAAMADGATGRFSVPGARTRMRLLHRRLGNDAFAMDSVRIAATSRPSGDGALVDLLSGTPRQINATPAIVEQDVGVGLFTGMQVRESAPGAFTAAGGGIANLAGVVAWRVDTAGDPLPGAYYTSLNDSSWTLQDFSQNVEGDGTGNGKSYDLAQLRAWLTATTIDPLQPMVFWWYVDIEPIGPTLVTERAQGMIDLADEACQLENLPRPRHILVIPHVHQRGSRTTDGLALAFDEFRAGFHAVAADPANDHVAVFSVQDATDRQFFDGRPEAVQWLDDNGYDAFEYGIYTGGFARNLVTQADLLDAQAVHPSNPTSAAFFASILVDGVLNPDGEPERCRSDLDRNDEVNFVDILLVLEVWGPCAGCEADFNGDGMVGFVDLLEVFSDWGICPE